MNPFTDHPRQLGESYWQHMAVATRVGVTMGAGAIACLIHAIFPFLFASTGSATIERLHRQVHKRIDAPNWERHPII